MNLSSPPIPSCWGRHDLEERALALMCIRDHVNQFLQSELAGLLNSTTGEGNRVKVTAVVAGRRGKSWVKMNEVTVGVARHTYRKSQELCHSLPSTLARRHCLLNPPLAGSFLCCIKHNCPPPTRKSLPADLRWPIISSATAVRFTSPKSYQPVRAITRF